MRLLEIFCERAQRTEQQRDHQTSGATADKNRQQHGEERLAGRDLVSPAQANRFQDYGVNETDQPAADRDHGKQIR